MEQRKAKRFILLISDDEALLFAQYQSGRHRILSALAPFEQSAEPLLNLLDASPTTPITLLSDSQHQSIITTSFPKLSWTDRRSLVQQRLKTHFPNATCKGHLFHTRTKALLFAQQPCPALAFWSREFESTARAFTCLGLSSLEMIPFSYKLFPQQSAKWRLSCHIAPNGKARLIVTVNKRFVLSRSIFLAHGKSTSATFHAAALMMEIQATCDYLKRHGLASTEALEIVGLAPDDIIQALSSKTNYRLLSPSQAAHSLFPAMQGFLPTTNCNGNLVYLLWQADKALSCPLRTPHQQSEYKQTIIQRTGLLITALLFLILFISWLQTAKQLWLESQQVINDTQTAKQLEEQLNDAAQRLQSDTTPLNALIRAAQRQRLFQPQQTELDKILAALRGQSGPNYVLDTLSWNGKELKIDIHFLPSPHSTDLDQEEQLLTDLQERLDGFDIAQQKVDTTPEDISLVIKIKEPSP